MPRDIAISVCEDFVKMGVRAVNFTGGGEPTVSPFLGECIEYLSSNNVKLGMFTNGTLLHRDNLVHKCLKNLEWLRFSIDAGTPETYNKIRRTVKGKNDWDVMISNLMETIRVKKYIGENKIYSKTADLGVGFVITPDTYHEIVEFANIFKNFDVSYCQFKPEIVNIERENGIQRTIEFWSQKVEPLLEEAKNILGDKFQINGYKLSDLKNDPSFYGRNYKKCLGSQIQPCIGADGEVYVCTNHRGHKKYSYGSLYEKSFSEIWGDIDNRRKIMSIIEDDEKFSKCTHLCKAHESSKKCWSLFGDYEAVKDNKVEFESWEDNLINIEQSNARNNIKHWEFI